MEKLINVFEDETAASEFIGETYKTLNLKAFIRTDEEGNDIYAVLPLEYRILKATEVFSINDRKKMKVRKQSEIFKVDDFSKDQAQLFNMAIKNLTITTNRKGSDSLKDRKMSIHDFTGEQLRIISEAVMPGTNKSDDEIREELESATGGDGGEIR